MKARIKNSSGRRSVTAFDANEYVRHEWRDVPAHCHEEAQRHPFIEVDELAVSPPEPDEIVHPVLAVDLEDMTVKELQEFAKKQDVTYSRLNKADLIAALRDD